LNAARGALDATTAAAVFPFHELETKRVPHSITLITTIAAALGMALIMGFISVRLKLPALVGCLIAGIIIGPATPGFVADVDLAGQLAEIGVTLLMFGVGLHFSLGDLLAVRKIALPGAILQVAVATALGMAVAAMWGWSLGEGLVFGLALSVASTVVLCAHSKVAAFWYPSTAASPLVGWWWKIWSWCWCWYCCCRWPGGSAATRPA
jgi:CPA2 family monovalent cation:H+ antiporter-2